MRLVSRWMQRFAKNRQLGLVLFASMLSVSCQEPTLQQTSRTSLGTRLSSARVSGIRTVDDRYADLAERVPGFGGLFYDSTGRLTVYLKTANQLASESCRKGYGRGRTPYVASDLPANQRRSGHARGDRQI